MSQTNATCLFPVQSRFALPVFAIIGVLTTSCTNERDSSGSIVRTLSTTCTGTYRCELPRVDGEPGAEAKLIRGEDDCWVIMYDEDGEPFGFPIAESVALKTGETAELAWTGDKSEFSVEFPSGGVFACTLSDDADDPDIDSQSSGSEGYCDGYASSCEGRGAGSCSSQDGCYAGWHVRWNGDLEFACNGVSEGCSSIHSEDGCNTQDGCRWHP